MGKSSKKSASKDGDVAIVAAPAPSPAKPFKKGKRESEVVTVSAKKQKVVAEKKSEKKKVESDTSSESESESEQNAKKAESSDDDSSSEDEAPPAPVAEKKDESDEDSSDGSSDEEIVADDEDVAPAAVATKKAESSDDNDEPSKKTAEEEKPAHSTGSKTLFVGNLSFDVSQADVEEFFKPAGEVVEVRFAMNREDDSFRGFGHVEFATAEQAEKALRELNGKSLLQRAVRLDQANERGADNTQRRGPGPKLEVFVKGFDSSEGEDKIRSSLTAHFSSCGEIVRVSIPTGEDGNSKGFAYVQFLDDDSRDKALGLNGSEFGNGSLTVDEPRPRGDSGGRGRGRGGRSDFGGGRGGRRGRSSRSGGRGGRGY